MGKRVIVLGGGVAGMSAAHELAERGFEVEVHEAKQVPGGKARSIPVPGTGQDGRPDLPGEHGFRFFPSFYRHLPDTMKRIPFRGQRRGVFDNLVQASEYLLADGPGKQLTFLIRFPESLREWGQLIVSFFRGKALGIPDQEFWFFVRRVLVILTSCQARRLAEYEKLSWWDFIDADNKSEAYRQYLATGLTRSLVALKAQEASTRTIGDILIQLLQGVYWPFTDFDRLLDGPTSEVWLAPWLAHLEALGVAYQRGSKVVSLEYGGGGLAGVTVESPDGTRRQVRGDYYVLALPVEQVTPLLTPEIEAADPRLAALAELRVSWMNGLQLFLRRDQPFARGHVNFVASPGALTAISQAQFARRPFSQYGDGQVQGCFSIDISDWEQPGAVSGRPLRELGSAEEVMREVKAQLQAALPDALGRVFDESNVATWFLDEAIQFPNPSPAVNLEPLLINTRDSWRHRPEAATAIGNLFLAADYVRTHTDLATMEAANEAARRAVNGILLSAGVAARPCRLWPLHEPAVFAPARALDWVRFKLGLPHLTFDARALSARPAARTGSTVCLREIAEDAPRAPERKRRATGGAG
jgi:15-cis-phytoene desaturase